jgi:protein ImuB
VETPGPGLAFFETDGLRGLHGTAQATIATAARALARPARIGAAPTRFVALAAALAVRSRRPLVLDGADARRWLAGRPVGLLGFRDLTAPLVAPLGRLGVRTLGELARLGRPALTDRFGPHARLRAGQSAASAPSA